MKVMMYFIVHELILGGMVTGTEQGADLGPLISPEAKQKVCDLIQSGVDEGAEVRNELIARLKDR